jgi:two-component system OmpR family sensor kinase
MKGISLRIRLVAGLLVLVAAALVVVGIVSVTALRSYLYDQVDEQLDRASGPGLGFLRPGTPPAVLGSTTTNRGPGPNQLYIELRNSVGETTRVFPLERGSVQEPAPKVPDIDPTVPGRTHDDVAAVDGSLRYRLLVVTRPGEGTAIFGASLQGVQDATRRLILIEVIAGFGVLLLVGIFATALVRLGLKPLDDMADTAGAIAAGDLTQRVKEDDPRTEVGRLGGALNSMLHQIEGAFAERTASQERLRRFVADAGHELRTPLTSIRGYAELYRNGAVPPGEPLDRAMGRIESEAGRMGVLVEDLLLLARLDQGRAPASDPVDLVAVVADCVHDALAVEPERHLATAVPDHPVVVLGDALRFHQVLANLLANVRVHTPSDTSAEVGLGIDGSWAVLTVADHGPGMEPEVAEHVFERFFRADPARTRQHGGAGLGLAIVAAIVEAHGGSVALDSTPGQGSTFTVRLPLAPAPIPIQLPSDSQEIAMLGMQAHR